MHLLVVLVLVCGMQFGRANRYLDEIRQHGYTSFADAIEFTGLVNELLTLPVATFMVPVNSAFDAFVGNLNDRGVMAQSFHDLDMDIMKEIVRYHCTIQTLDTYDLTHRPLEAPELRMEQGSMARLEYLNARYFIRPDSSNPGMNGDDITPLENSWPEAEIPYSMYFYGLNDPLHTVVIWEISEVLVPATAAAAIAELNSIDEMDLTVSNSTTLVL